MASKNGDEELDALLKRAEREYSAQFGEDDEPTEDAGEDNRSGGESGASPSPGDKTKPSETVANEDVSPNEEPQTHPCLLYTSPSPRD